MTVRNRTAATGSGATRLWHICSEHRNFGDPPCVADQCVALCGQPMRGDAYRRDDQVGDDSCDSCAALDALSLRRRRG